MDREYTVKTGYHVAKRDLNMDENGGLSTSYQLEEVWKGIWSMKDMLKNYSSFSKDERDLNWNKIGITTWAIWKARNTKCFNNTDPNPSTTIFYAKLLEQEIAKNLNTTINTKIGTTTTGTTVPV
ncbi:hypothetical protein PIB30_061094 [Stylosanthes scabra]|uniref:Uncharacterized protein n=1 Tax=Stylosanthes scabra TaxID=79078 RepID=A0ABU6UJK2_9FABA|nr:hypothetical protein [Stylosanthes scabra]